MGDYESMATLPGTFADLARRIAALERSPRVVLPTYTAATKPAAGDVPTGTVIHVSDGGAGAVFQGSTGAAWVNLG